MAGEVLNMSILDINKHRCKLKDLCFKNRHKTIYLTLPVTGMAQIRNKQNAPINAKKKTIRFLEKYYEKIEPNFPSRPQK